MRVSKLFFLFFSLSSCAVFGQVHIDVNESAGHREISPYIYGMNSGTWGGGDSVFSAVRLGGNRFTGYNWETNFSNSGVDNGNNSDSYLVNQFETLKQGIPGSAITEPSIKAKLANQFITVTVPMAGYVAADKLGVVKREETAPSARWCNVKLSKGSAFSMHPDLNDGTVYVDEEINYLMAKLGSSSRHGVNAYALDNEPDFWGAKHPVLRMHSVTAAELMLKSEQWAVRIKSLDPNAQIIGPALANIDGLLTLGAASDFMNQTGPIRYSRFMNLYLDSMKRAEIRYGKRLLDVFDFHWYPEQIVSYKFDGNDPTDSLMVVKRLQAPRALWDTTYKDPTYSLRLVKEMNSAVEKFYPGTKIGFTEFLYGAEDHFSGGLALADVLGVFGREGVYLANKWYITDSKSAGVYGMLAYQLYRNYNGVSGQFGNISVAAQSGDLSSISSVASLDEKNKLHVIVVNKKWKDTVIEITTKQQYEFADVWGFDSDAAIMIHRDSVKGINEKVISVNVPKYSATHFVFEPKKYIYIERAQTSNFDSSKIVLYLSEKLVGNEMFDETGLFVRDVSKNVDMKVSSIRYSVDSAAIILTTASKFSSFSEIDVTLSEKFYCSTSGVCVKAGVVKVDNTLPMHALNCYRASTSRDGYFVILQMNKQLSVGSSSLGGIKLLKNASIYSVVSSIVDGDSLILNVNERFNRNDVITVQLPVGSVKGIDGSTFGELISVSVQNVSSDVSPVVIATEIADGGYTVKSIFDLWLSNQKIDGFSVLVNGVQVKAKFAIDFNTVHASLDTNIKFGDVVEFNYSKNGTVTSYWGGRLDPFNVIVQNNVPEVEYILVPSKIEAELFSYKSSGVELRSSSELGTLGNELYGLEAGDKVGYGINVVNGGRYAFIMRYATISAGEFVLYLDSKSVDTVKFFGSSSNWHNLVFFEDLPVGKHVLELRPLTGFLTLRSLDVNVINVASLVKTEFYSKTKIVAVEFDVLLKELPSADVFTLVDENNSKLPISKVAFGEVHNIVFVYVQYDVDVKSIALSIDTDKLEFEYGLKAKTIDNRLIYSTRLGELSSWLRVFENNKKIYFLASDDVLLGDLSIQIFTSNGALVSSISKYDGHAPLSLHLSPGLFVAQVRVGDSFVVERFVVR